VQNSKMCHVTLTTPLSWMVDVSRLGLAIINLKINLKFLTTPITKT